ncbi:MAG: response regulator transcription factor [Reichenbachiella sp.]
MNQLRILIVDDHALFSSGAAELIQNHFNAIVDKISNPTEVLSIAEMNYDIIISDIDMPEMNGIELIDYIKSKKSSQKVMVISMHNKLSIVSKCQNLGVEGYILKFDDNATFLEAIEEVLTGKQYYSSQVIELLNENIESNVFFTPREEQVIKEICLGHSVSEIGKSLYISTETVKSHYKNIRSKLGVKSKSEIIQYGRENLLI